MLKRYFLGLTAFVSLLSLPFFVGCGDAEEPEEPNDPIFNNTLPDVSDEHWLQLTQWLQLTDEDWKALKDKDWEKLKGENWTRLTDAEVEELMNLKIPRWNGEPAAWEEARKYRHARLFQEFGDIPQVRYIVEFERRPSRGLVILTLALAEQHLAYRAANYFLYPNANNQRTFEDNRNSLKAIAERKHLRFLEQRRIEDPEVWAKSMYAFLIRKHGKIPEVNTIANFLRKLELNLPRTDKECYAYFEVYDALYDDMNTASYYEFYALLEALYQIRAFVKDPPSRSLEKYREARAEDIPFYDIDWDDD
ncbi:hypothetical protein J5I95_11955 [Candidatus Poribacteria bacterium]|nr:hypothetical protein [Candidatus Poribacteria bacterium]